MNTEAIEAIERGCEGVTPGPWHYRPEKYDDWGWVRASKTDSLLGELVANVRSHARLDEDALNQHRINGTDPSGPTAQHIARLDPQTVLELCRLAKLGLASATASPVPGVKGLELEWAKNGRHDGNLWTGELAFRTFYTIEGDMDVLLFRVERGQFLTETGEDLVGIFPSLDQAKAAAQADYAARILSALEPAAAVPEGWKLVPVKIAGQMVEQGSIRFHEWDACETVQDIYDLFRKQWARALEAAPEYKP